MLLVDQYTMMLVMSQLDMGIHVNKRFSDEQVIIILRDTEMGFRVANTPFSNTNLYISLKKFGCMEVPEVKRIKSLEKENALLLELFAEACRIMRRFRLPLGESTDVRLESGMYVNRSITTSSLKVYIVQ